MHTDMLGGVAVLIKPLVADLSGRVYDSKQLAERLETAYGLDLPGDALEDFTSRLITNGILVIEENGSGMKKAVYAQQQPVPDDNSTEEFQRVLDDFVAHAQKLLTRTTHSFTEDELHAAFLRHLSTLDFSAIKAKPILVNEDEGKLLGPSAKEQINLSSELQRGAALDAIVASYVTGLHAAGGESLSLLAKVADGALAAELVFDLRAPHSVPRLTNTTIVLDTPLILSLLDLSSAQDKEDARRLVTGITNAGAKVAAYQHSLEEAEGVLAATNTARQHGEAYGPAVTRLSGGIYRAYYESMSGKIANHWQQRNHYDVIQETATHFHKNFTGDEEEKLVAYLRSSLADRVLTRERDGKSVAETMRRLGGTRVNINDISSCRMMFVTSNSTLAQRATSFLRDHGFVQKGEFSPVVTNRYLAGLCWLIAGGESSQSPTTARLLSNCAAALQLRPEISHRTKRFLKDIDPEMALHFEALMTNERAAQLLAEVTFNDPNLITANNVEDIYAEVQRRAAEKVGNEKDAYYAEKLTELDNERLTAKAAEAALQARLEAVELDAENDRITANRLSEEATRLAVAHSQQRTTLEEQENQLQSMQGTIHSLASQTAAQKSTLENYVRGARSAAQRRAQSWTTAARVMSSFTLFLLAGLLGYFDKFIVPQLSLENQPIGNGFIIFVQALSAIGGAIAFCFKRPFEAIREKIYQSRLEAMGIPPEPMDRPPQKN